LNHTAPYAEHGLKQSLPRKSLLSHSKEITKAAVFAQPITLLELARSETDRTILRKIYERIDQNEYGFGWHCGSD
jgi:hypothetical protein